MNILTVNQLVEFLEDQRLERVLWVDIQEPGYVLIDIQKDKASPVLRLHRDLETLLDNGALRLAMQDPFLASAVEEDIPSPHRDLRDQNWERIAPLLARQPDIFDPIQRGRIIAELVVERQESRHSLYRLLRRYWQRGQTRNALLPDYAKCGGRGKDKAVGAKPRGRPPKNGDQAVSVTPAMRRLFRAAVTRFYATHPVFDLNECYFNSLRTSFVDSVVNQTTGRQEMIVRPGAPTLRQFCYWYEKDSDIFEVPRRRRTPRIYDKDMRGLLGTSTGEVYGPGARYQIDATIADIYLLSRYHRDKIVGRPVAYVVIDVFSHMIVGIHAGFEGPSWVGAMEALGNAVLDKVEYCRKFGVEITLEEWPSVGMPERLLGDRGELAGRMVETLIRAKRPQSNGIVERLHRTLLDEHFRVEGRRTWFETIEEMQNVLDQYLVEYNTKRPHQGRGMNGRTPLKAFREGIRKQPKEATKTDIVTAA